MKRSISINVLCFFHIVQKFIGLRIQCPNLIIGIVKVYIGFFAYSSSLLSVFPDSCPDLPRLLQYPPLLLSILPLSPTHMTFRYPLYPCSLPFMLSTLPVYVLRSLMTAQYFYGFICMYFNVFYDFL
jgi:hypothetical protein